MGDNRAFLSIGDVLTLLKEDFPDVTISKIRFLESQGLLDPERTPSGYRKFYEEDVERLRWILRQQRENFLPLKVIKGRLEGGGETPPPAAGQLQLGINGEGRAVEEDAGLAGHTAPSATAAAGSSGGQERGGGGVPGSGRPADAGAIPEAHARAEIAETGHEDRIARGPSEPGGTAPSHRPATAGGARPTGDDDGLRVAREALGLTAPRSGGTPRAAREALGLTSNRPHRPTRAAVPAGPETTTVDPGGESREEAGASLTAEEMSSACDLPLEEIDDLMRFGLITGRPVAGTVYFDEEALSVARLAAGFRRYGIQARHIRIYRLAAEREVGLFEQVILPILKQRNPEARKQARQALSDLSRLGHQMRTAMVRAILRGLDNS